MRSLERVNIRTNERTYSHTYVRDRPYIPLHHFVVRGDNKRHPATSSFNIKLASLCLSNICGNHGMDRLTYVENSLLCRKTI